MVVTISSKYQVVIPREVRKALGLKSGEKAQVIPYRNRIELVPLRTIKEMRGFLNGMDTRIDRGGERL
jgi:AbrB family looped-hinge helix DNA binding protein